MAKNRVQVQGVSAPTLKNSIGGLGQTFVSPDANPRGAQIAKALSNVIAPAVQQKVDEYQEDVRYVDGLKAKNHFALLEPSLREHMSNADYSIREQADGSIRRLSSDEHFASWAQADEYQEAIDGLGSKTAQQALEHSVGQSIASGYGAGAVAYDQEELRQVLSQSLQIGLSQGQLPAADVWANHDDSLGNTNLMDRPERMEQLLLSAEKHLRDTGSTSGFDYIESRGMGNDKWKMKAEDLKETTLNNVALANDKQYKADKLKRGEDRRRLIVTAGQRLLKNPSDDLTDLVEQGLAAGIAGIKGDLNTVIKSHDPTGGQPFKMTNADKILLQEELSSKGTKEAQMDFLLANAAKIDNPTLTTWLGWAHSGSLFSLEKDPDYSAAVDYVKGELKKEGAGESWKDVEMHLKDIYLQLIETDEYKNAGTLERLNLSDKVLDMAMKRAGATNNQPNQPLSAEIERTDEVKAAAKAEQATIDNAITAMVQVEEAKKAQAQTTSLSNVQSFADGSSDTVPTLDDLRNLVSGGDVEISEDSAALINDAIKNAGGDVDEATLKNIITQVTDDESFKAKVLEEREARKAALTRDKDVRTGLSATRSLDPEVTIAREEQEDLEDAQDDLEAAERKLQIALGERAHNARGHKRVSSPKALAKAEEAVKRAQEELTYAEKVISIK